MRRLPFQYTRRTVLSDFLLKRHSYKENDKQFLWKMLFVFLGLRLTGQLLWVRRCHLTWIITLAVKITMEARCLPWAIQYPCRRWYFSKRTVSSYLSASLEVPGGLEGLGFLVYHHNLALHAVLWVLAGQAIPRPLLVPRDQDSQEYLVFLARHNSNFDHKSVEIPKYKFAHLLPQKISIEQEWIVLSLLFE